MHYLNHNMQTDQLQVMTLEIVWPIWIYAGSRPRLELQYESIITSYMYLQ